MELPHFMMGKSYGSNQNWMMDPWMHLGGCAALTTCDAFIDFSLYVNFLKKVPYTAFDVLSPVRIPHLQPALLVHL